MASTPWRGLRKCLVLFLASALPVFSQSLQLGQTWHYRLIDASSFLNDCLPCGLVSRPVPMRGGFDLILSGATPIATTYVLTNINWVARDGAGQEYQITGQGTWQIGGEVAIVQTVTLQTTVQTASGPVTRSFTNASSRTEYPWPVLDTQVFDTAGQVFRYELRLVAEPFREIWFTTASGMTPTGGGAYVNSGDIITDGGRVVRSKSDLTSAFGSLPGNFSLDAFGVLPGGDFVYSLDQDLTNSPFGFVQNGDMLAEAGGVVATNQDLTAAFGIMPPAPDLGLTGVQSMDDGTVLFSISQDAFSETLGIMITHGDLLSNQGQVVKSNQELMSHFQAQTAANPGLKSFHVWPDGEVWFSVEKGFTDAALGPVGSGDLLSDRGLIVFRNLELVQAFAPGEDLSNFGLTGLFVASDDVPPAAPPVLSGPSLDQSSGDLTLNWVGRGRVFQVLKTDDLATPFAEASSIVPGSSWVDEGAVQAGARAFYRLRQW